MILNFMCTDDIELHVTLTHEAVFYYELQIQSLVNWIRTDDDCGCC